MSEIFPDLRLATVGQCRRDAQELLAEATPLPPQETRRHRRSCFCRNHSGQRGKSDCRTPPAPQENCGTASTPADSEWDSSYVTSAPPAAWRPAGAFPRCRVGKGRTERWPSRRKSGAAFLLVHDQFPQGRGVAAGLKQHGRVHTVQRGGVERVWSSASEPGRFFPPRRCLWP